MKPIWILLGLGGAVALGYLFLRSRSAGAVGASDGAGGQTGGVPVGNLGETIQFGAGGQHESTETQNAEAASEAIATNQVVEQGITLDDAGVNTFLASRGIEFVGSQVNPLTGGEQRVFQLTDPRPGYARGFTESSLGIPGEPDTFVEVVPLGVASVASNVVISGELPQHTARPATFDNRDKVEQSFQKFAETGSAEDAANYVKTIVEDRRSSSSSTPKPSSQPASKQVTVNLGGSGLSTTVVRSSTPAQKAESKTASPPSSSKSTGRTVSQVAKSLSASDPRRKGVLALGGR